MKPTSQIIEEFEMKHQLAGYHAAKGAYGYLIGAVSRLILILVGISLVVKLVGCTQDDTDADRWATSGLVPLTDAKTGVQYLRTSHGLTPRLDRDGKVMVQTTEKP